MYGRKKKCWIIWSIWTRICYSLKWNHRKWENGIAITFKWWMKAKTTRQMHECENIMKNMNRRREKKKPQSTHLESSSPAKIREKTPKFFPSPFTCYPFSSFSPSSLKNFPLRSPLNLRLLLSISVSWPPKKTPMKTSSTSSYLPSVSFVSPLASHYLLRFH